MPTAAQTLLARHGVRSTRQRLAVLEALTAEPNDATAQEIHAELVTRGRAVGLATVYRTLALLSEHGVVDALTHRNGELCYRMCGEGHHHHLTCSECHRVVEIADCTLEPWLHQVASEHGFTATAHHVELLGVCANCRS
ncbi:MAG: Fur family transcriptional regulator, ferric uptake regulator [Gaiellaceae bacterium]|nr:Fur family transcriptional regulator, ferric uptake regulator [Gaiellaceae bacterium]